MATVLITGGTGLIGSALSTLLINRDYNVIILSRDSTGHKKPPNQLSYAWWNVSKQLIDPEAVKKADYVIHLAGAGVAEKRWTAKRKKEIVGSRIQSSALIIKALKENANEVRAVIAASAIGWYGADPAIPSPRPFVETDPPDPGFLGETCRLWEQSMDPVTTLGKRLVKLRTGIVLSNEGGAWVEFKRPVQFGIAGILGSGKQMISWLHIDDLCRMYLQAIEDESLSGVYNAVAPQPVNNKELTLQLTRAVRGKYYIPVHIPAVALKLILGEMSVEVLKSTTVNPDRIRKAGFTFLYPSILAAVHQLTNRNKL